MSMASRGAPVMDGEAAELSHAWINKYGVRSGQNASKLAS
jgi:hypothetical protein